MKNVRRKVMAVLAGGLMLGVGATITLASWNDSEFAGNTFHTGGYKIEGSTAGATAPYSQHSTAGGAADLTFSLNDGSNLSPGDVTYAPYWVKSTFNSGYNANLVSTGVTARNEGGSGGSNVANLSYEIRSIPPTATCNAASAAAGTLVASGATLDAHTAGQAVPMTHTGGVLPTGNPIQLCFVITAGPQLNAYNQTSATWGFQATTTSS